MKTRFEKLLAALLLISLVVPGIALADGMVPPSMLTAAEGTGSVLEVTKPDGGSIVLTSTEEIRGFLEAEAEKVTPALNQLEAFIHKVETDLEHRSITPDQAYLYILMAQDVIDLLTGN